MKRSEQMYLEDPLKGRGGGRGTDEESNTL
jgi:hypothetical protein